MDNSCKRWSPIRKGPGRSSAGIASTPHFLDQLLASSPSSQKSILVGTSRSAFEARSISFACSLRPLRSRLRWGWKGNAWCAGVWEGCKREDTGKGGEASVYEPNPKRSWNGLCLQTSRPSHLTILSLSLGLQRTAKHMRQQVPRCVPMGVDCMKVLLPSPLHTHHSAPQWASTRANVPPTCTQTTARTKHHPREASLGV